MSRRNLVLLASMASLALAPPVSADAAKRRSCPTAGVLATVKQRVVFHKGDRLYACVPAKRTARGSGRPVIRALGPYDAETQIAFDGYSLAWTRRLVIDGTKVERVSVADVGTRKRWLTDSPAVPQAFTPAHDGLVRGLDVSRGGVTWVTEAGEVVVAGVGQLNDLVYWVATPSPPRPPLGNIAMIGSYGAEHASHIASTLNVRAAVVDRGETGEDRPRTRYRLDFTPSPGVGVQGAEWLLDGAHLPER